MAYERRVRLMEQISALREAVLICYVAGDRENVGTRVASDVVPVIYRHLELCGPQPRIDLFLYTRGGDILTPWRLVHLIREYTPHFAVLVPYRAYSAGTLICLGADEILMGKMGELGPIDPSVVNAFSPQDPCQPSARIPVHVEDVIAYMALAREKAGLSGEEELSQAFHLLAERIHPLTLGNVHRNYLLIRSLARRLLYLHYEPAEEERVERIVNSLTERLYAHNHMIPRAEAARDIKLPVVCPPPELEKLIWELFRDYALELRLDEPFNPLEVLEGRRTEFEVVGGFVESRWGQDAFVFSGVIERRDLPEPGHVDVNIYRQSWRTRV